tara:strand:- start:79 stop:387 length:309 start_codon:yes stop_codon:yes gene_type:complete
MDKHTNTTNDNNDNEFSKEDFDQMRQIKAQREASKGVATISTLLKETCVKTESYHDKNGNEKSITKIVPDLFCRLMNVDPLATHEWQAGGQFGRELKLVKVR